LTLTTGGFADHPYPLAMARSAPGSVEMVGWNIPDAARKLAIGKVENLDSVSLFHPQVANPVRLRVEPHPAVVQEGTNDLRHPQTVALPVTITGRLGQAGDLHAFRFEAKKGQRLQFQAEAQALGFPLTPVLCLTDAAGKVLARAEGPALGRDPELPFVVPQDGRYQVELRDLHGDGGPRFLYRLRALLAEPDFQLTVAADRFALVPGKPLDIPVTIDQRNGPGGAIEVVAEGLPEGVVAGAVTVAPGARAATLRLTGGAMVVSVPIRILGRYTGKDGLVRTARTAITGLNDFTPHLWLTVLRPTEATKKLSPG